MLYDGTAVQPYNTVQLPGERPPTSILYAITNSATGPAPRAITKAPPSCGCARLNLSKIRPRLWYDLKHISSLFFVHPSSPGLYPPCPTVTVFASGIPVVSALAHTHCLRCMRKIAIKNKGTGAQQAANLTELARDTAQRSCYSLHDPHSSAHLHFLCVV